MKTLRKVELTHEIVETVPEVLEQNKIYISFTYRTAIHLCLCGCGNQAVTPLTKDWWNLSLEGGKVTMKPSILNRNCPNHYHYIITNSVANVC
jgi:hypothetical protein